MSDITEIVEQVVINEIVEQVAINEGGTYNFANPKPDWNALEGEDNEILNKPNLGTAALTNIETFATAAQGSKADNSVQLTGDQSISGIKTFNSPLILPNNSRINGIEHFYQTTKPVTRIEGSPLVVGDIWYSANTLIEFVFNGTYWVTKNLLMVDASIINVSTANTPFSNVLIGSVNPIFSGIFISHINYHYRIGINDANNYWVFRIGLGSVGGNPTAILFEGSTSTSSTNTIFATNEINSFYPLTTQRNFVIASGSKVGSPSNLSVWSNCFYRLVSA